jgi:alkaline phosphatase D
MLGAQQERWLAETFRQSTGDWVRWQVLAQQVLMGSISLSQRAVGWLGADAAPEVKQRAAVGLAASRAGLPFNFDMWDGYPAARDRLLRSALDANANLIVLSGDSHNGWAFDLDQAGTPAGVDFGVQSVTSPGYEAYLPKIRPGDIARTLVEHNRQLRWADTYQRGYMTLELTPERATNEWLFLDTVRQRSTRIAGRHRAVVTRGSNRIA